MRVICTLSGGKSSFVAAMSAFLYYDPKDIMLYFNDTLWEHQDLYRFLDDIETYLNHKIYKDSDGRDPSDVFYDESFLGNNRVPLCSRILKAEKLQSFYDDGDILIFGIGLHELHRCQRIVNAYTLASKKRNCYPIIKFPLVELGIDQKKIDYIFSLTGIRQPLLYDYGFEHNNCSGGCVRQGKKQWLHLLEVLPEVYKEREDLEKQFRKDFNKDVHFLKDMTLTQLRNKKEIGLPITFDDDLQNFECIGICNND